jgi:hypothetical protein
MFKQISRLCLLTLAVAAMSLAATTKSFTGTISDAMCGAKHMGDNAKACTISCAKSSGYALVVGDKIYKLNGKTAQLEKYAAEKATVHGTVSGDTITVSSVAAAK